MLGLTGFSLEYDKLKAVATELYPRGSHTQRSSNQNTRPAPWKRGWLGYHAEQGDDPDYLEDYNEEESALWGE